MRGRLPALDHAVVDPARAPYVSRINGHLGATVLSAFPGLAPRHLGADTPLTGQLVLVRMKAVGTGAHGRGCSEPLRHSFIQGAPEFSVDISFLTKIEIRWRAERISA